nr:nucleotidyl transferase AbiEii/AbiGii toxin family protein [Clostridium ganghwense]
MKDRIVLKGGACMQLYIPLEVQRCTEDLDLYTDLSPNKLRKEMKAIEKEFNTKKIHIKIKEYIPKSVMKSGKTLPITTFIVKFPFIFRENKKSKEGSLKIDFLHADIRKLHTTGIKQGEVLGLHLNYVPIIVDNYSAITSKLVTFAVNTIGIERFKKDKLYKNAYDMFYMIKRHTSVDVFKKVTEYMKKSMAEEFRVKKLQPMSIERVIDDILQELYYLSAYDLKENFTGYSKRLLDFQINYIQQGIKEKLDFDSWGIICAHLYLWVYALKHYILFKEPSKLEYISKIEEEYNFYKELTKEKQSAYLENIKKQLLNKKSRYLYDYIEEPLRFIYLYHIYFNKN